MAQPAQNVQTHTQSAGHSGTMDDIALIEQQTDSGLLSLLEHYEPVKRFDDLPPDMLEDRFQILVHEPLPQFDTAAASAYAAMDKIHPSRPVYALVCDPRIPTRQKAITNLRGLTHPGLVVLRDYGSVKLSHNDKLRLVLFVERPQGIPLTELIASKGRFFHERQVIDTILAPIIDALAAMHDTGVCHGRINLSNVYFNDRAVLGECMSEPYGMTQHYFYEPLERLLANPTAKGAPTTKTDAYALGMLAFDILFGLDKYQELGRENLIRYLLEKGAYHCFVAHRDFGETFADFFRGTLNENKQERWGLDQLRNWVAGKRFNLIMPSLPKEATRAFEFNDHQYFSTRALANGIYNSWPVASKLLRQSKLDRWLEMSAHQPEKSVLVKRTIQSYGGEEGGAERSNNEMISRIIITLDPLGPIRSKSISLNVDGLGLAMAMYYKERDHVKLQMLMTVIQSDLPSFWADSCPAEKTTLTSHMLGLLHGMRSYLERKQFGFGVERLIYDLNPSLACQSEWLLPYSVQELEQTLNVLDALAKTHAESTPLSDRHLCAFLASKVELTRELKFNQLQKVPKLRDNPELLALRILNIAQEKSGKPKLVGLASWAAIRVDKLLDHIHSRKLRQKIREDLKLAAQTGMVGRVLAVVVENDMTKEDHIGFKRANSVYLRNSARIEALKSGATIDKMSQDFGGRMATFIAYTILGITIYSLLDIYYL